MSHYILWLYKVHNGKPLHNNVWRQIVQYTIKLHFPERLPRFEQLAAPRFVLIFLHVFKSGKNMWSQKTRCSETSINNDAFGLVHILKERWPSEYIRKTLYKHLGKKEMSEKINRCYLGEYVLQSVLLFHNGVRVWVVDWDKAFVVKGSSLSQNGPNVQMFEHLSPVYACKGI